MNEAEKLFSRLNEILNQKNATHEEYLHALCCVKEARRFYPNLYAHGGWYWWNQKRLKYPVKE